ncbi:GGDEF domain-containing protein [Aurantimonas sp. 22II-16-19i]|uniref:GGDEF domain-containing protein n=1 Tax=Aurantimonas sp. 22II-16-19i TaxID=1317114 RepID=UPI0009F7BC9B|nr:GGDEF domain-containing protein [Aurantimonas sp. 22II-16-19i]ORE90265.1 putative diguanylate cyclase [Aurantimonas sp. 22II-16-19i]
MRFYAFMQRIGWPRSYIGKILAICFLGTHVPLIALVVWLLAQDRLVGDLGIVAVVLVATLAGTIGALLGLYAMLSPILAATGALDRYARERTPPNLPTIHGDAAGRLMTSVQTTLQQLDRTIDKLEALSVTDPLTGLYNRRWIDDVGERAVANARREKRRLSMLVIDVDHFKSFNDTHGHSLGDQVLILVADAIREAIGSHGQAVRLGGDEFCVLLPNAGRDEGEEAARRIRLAMELGIDNFLGPETVTLSIGVSTLRGDDMSLHHLQRRADQQLFNAKRSGRNRMSME